MSEADSTPVLEVKISSYYIVGDGLTFDQHYFVVNVTLYPSSLSYFVDRNYVDFVDLDKKISKKFPHTCIPPLPLMEKEVIEKYLNKVATNGKSITPIATAGAQKPKEWFVGSNDHNPLLIPIVNDNFRTINDNNYSNKIDDLTMYLLALLNLHEIVASEELQYFFDEEVSSMQVDIKSLNPLNVHDILLLNNNDSAVTVRKEFQLNIAMKKDQILIWRFSTKYYDIGFSVDFNEETKIVYTRYNSHQQTAMGSLKATEDGTVYLKWDNSYAKLRTKKLSYATRVIKQEDYDIGFGKAMEVQREKRKFLLQRHALKKSVITHASKLSSGVVHTASVVHEENVEERRHIQQLESEIYRLNNEIETLCTDIDTAADEIDDLEAQKIAAEEALLLAEEARDQMSSSWRFTVTQLEALKQEHQQIQQQNSDMKKEKTNYLLQIQALTTALGTKNISIPAIPSASDSDEVSQLHKALENAQLELLALKQRNNQAVMDARTKIRMEMESEIASLKQEYELKYQELKDSLKSEYEEITTGYQALQVRYTEEVQNHAMLKHSISSLVNDSHESSEIK
jgi:hypothetical protein